MTNLPDGSYTVLIADDINLEYFNARGLFYSGHTAPCATTDPPVTAITSYTFTVGAPAPPPIMPPPPALPPPAPTLPPPPPAPSPTAIALGVVEVRTLAKRALAKRYRKSYRYAKAKRLTCTATSARRSRCRFSFTYARFRYSGTVSVFKDATGVDTEVSGNRRRR